MILALTGLFSILSILFIVVGLVVGIAGTYFAISLRNKKIQNNAQQEANLITQKARQEAEEIKRKGELESKAGFVRRSEQFEKESTEIRNELRETERSAVRLPFGVRKIDINDRMGEPVSRCAALPLQSARRRVRVEHGKRRA